MTPETLRKHYRFPQRVEARLEWRFYPKGKTQPYEFLALRFDPVCRKFSSMFCLGVGGIEMFMTPDPTDILLSFLPAVAVAECTAASLQLGAHQ